MSTLKFNPLNPMFNCATQMMARKVWPQGYDLTFSDESESFKRIKEQYSRRGRIYVYAGASDRTIFDDAGTNIDFRAWHDYCHLKLDQGFSLEGETAACELQCQHLFAHYGDGATGQELAALCRAEVIGQARHYAKYKAFVGNQRAFAMEYLMNQDACLSHNWAE